MLTNAPDSVGKTDSYLFYRTKIPCYEILVIFLQNGDFC